jgi:hypothetical protein
MVVLKRALIIGSETGGLAGVHNDVATIGPRLEARGFELDVHTGADASREGILAGLRRLITDSGPDDAALIYYSGHGARIRNPRYTSGSRGEPQLLQSLVPTDWGDGGFRGLLGVELSLCLAELTEKTHNVAVILDCCHSARMWRGVGDDAVARALERAEVETLGDRLEQLTKLDLSKLHAESNPHAVRLVAAEADRSAYELKLDFQGKRQSMGIMTAMLCAVLDELGDARVSWRTLGMLVRERVMQRYDYQRPELEGPGRRYVFEVAKAEFGGGVVYFQDRGQPALRTSRLLGAELGARYAIMAAGCGEYDESKIVAEAEIIDIAGTLARVRLDPREGAPEPSMGALAFLLAAPLSTRAVRIRGEGAAAEAMRELIWASKYLSLALDSNSAAFIELEVGEQLTLFRDSDTALTFPVPNDSAGQQRTLDELERRARADALRNLGDGELDARVDVKWGRVIDGQPCPMTAGETVHVGDALYVELGNASKVALLFAVFDIGVDGAITLLTAAEPSGTKIEPGKSYVLGLELGNRGLPMSWPEHTPAAVSLPESLIVIASTERHDFTALEGRRSGPEASELEQILGQIGGGGIRNLGAERRRDSGAYLVQRIDFLTSPQPRGI